MVPCRPCRSLDRGNNRISVLSLLYASRRDPTSYHDRRGLLSQRRGRLEDRTCAWQTLLVIMHAPARARQCLSKTEKLNQIPGVGLFGLEVRLGGGLEAPFDGRVGRGGEGVRLGLCLHWLPALFVEHVVLEEELRGGDIPRPSEALACNQRSSEEGCAIKGRCVSHLQEEAEVRDVHGKAEAAVDKAHVADSALGVVDD